MSKAIKTTLFLVVIGGAVSAPYFINSLVNPKIHEAADKVLAQSLSHESMNADYFGDQIVFTDFVMYDNNKPVSQFNAKAKELRLHVDYHNAIIKDFQVQRITASDVTLNITYAGRGESNIHRLQDNLRHYLRSKPTGVDHKKATWDVYDMVLTNITVNLQDDEIGNIGTFRIPELSLPRISSTYSKESNRDTLLLAITKEISMGALNGTLDGEYDKMKLMKFARREFQHEAEGFAGSLKEKAFSKAKDMASSLMQKMREN